MKEEDVGYISFLVNGTHAFVDVPWIREKVISDPNVTNLDIACGSLNPSRWGITEKLQSMLNYTGVEIVCHEYDDGHNRVLAFGNRIMTLYDGEVCQEIRNRCNPGYRHRAPYDKNRSNSHVIFYETYVGEKYLLTDQHLSRRILNTELENIMSFPSAALKPVIESHTTDESNKFSICQYADDLQYLNDLAKKMGAELELGKPTGIEEFKKHIVDAIDNLADGVVRKFFDEQLSSLQTMSPDEVYDIHDCGLKWKNK